MKNNIAGKELIIGCQKGNRISQKKLYKKYFGKLCAVAYSYVGKEFYKDIVQDSLIKFLNNLDKYKNESGNVQGWLRRITINTSIDYLRKNKINFLRATRTFDPNLSEDLDSLIESKELDYYTEDFNKEEYCKVLKYKTSEQELLEMINKLTPSYRTCFNLFALDNFTYREIALKLGISVGCIKSNVHRAKQKIIKQLETKIKRVIT